MYLRKIFLAVNELVGGTGRKPKIPSEGINFFFPPSQVPEAESALELFRRY